MKEQKDNQGEGEIITGVVGKNYTKEIFIFAFSERL